MKKLFSLIVVFVLIVSGVFAQQIADKTKLAKAQAKGKIQFESILKDVEFVAVGYWEEANVELYEGYWILKFENGAVVAKFVSNTRKNPWKDMCWWIGKKYVVIKKKVFVSKRWEVWLLEEPEELDKKQ